MYTTVLGPGWSVGASGLRCALSALTLSRLKKCYKFALTTHTNKAHLL